MFLVLSINILHNSVQQNERPKLAFDFGRDTCPVQQTAPVHLQCRCCPCRIYTDKRQFEDWIEEILMADKYDIPDLNEPET
jgi:hypothetical protein